MNNSFNQISGVNEEDRSVNVVIEIPQGSRNKIEWDRRLGFFVLDRIEPQIFAKPVNYGFIPQTLDEDGDELDVLVICPEPLMTGILVNRALVLGALNFIDDGQVDSKIVCTPRKNLDSLTPKSLSEIDQALLDQIKHHFLHYKDLSKPGTVEVLGWTTISQAWQIIKDCQIRAQKEKWW